jgi:hypothetical protein
VQKVRDAAAKSGNSRLGSAILNLADATLPFLEQSQRLFVGGLRDGHIPSADEVSGLLPAVQRAAAGFRDAARLIDPTDPDIDPALRPAVFQAAILARAVELHMNVLLRMLLPPPCRAVCG